MARTQVQLRRANGLAQRGLYQRGGKMMGFGLSGFARAEGKNKKEQVADTPVMFETLEPRILMNAPVFLSTPPTTTTVPIVVVSTPAATTTAPVTTNAPVVVPSTPPATTTVLSSSSHPVVIQDANGTQLTASLSGHGSWQITDGPGGLQLTVSNTDANSQLTLSTTAAGGHSGQGHGNNSSGNPHFLLNGIDLQGALRSITGTSVDIQGTFTAESAINAISLGDFKPNSQFNLLSLSQTSDIDLGNVTDLSLTSAGAIGSPSTRTEIRSSSRQRGVNASLRWSRSRHRRPIFCGNHDAPAMSLSSRRSPRSICSSWTSIISWPIPRCRSSTNIPAA